MNKLEGIIDKNKIETGKHTISSYDIMDITVTDYHNNRFNINEPNLTEHSEATKRVSLISILWR